MNLSDLFSNPDQKITGPYSGLSSGADTARFPAVYTLSDMMNDARMADIGPDVLILGVDGTGELLTMDLSGDNPHALISAGTGGGKSNTLRALAAQGLARGYQVVILDVKRHSHMWAEGLPNVLIARSIGEIGNALKAVGEEVHIRNHIAETWLRAQREAGNWDADISGAPVGLRTLVLYEEMNSTHQEVIDMTREKFRNSSEYTAVQGFKDASNLGRASKIHLLCVGQYMAGRAMGSNHTDGNAVRANFSTRILMNHDAKAWAQVAFDCGLPLAAPEERGRAYLCRNGKARMIQLLKVSEREARTFVETHSRKALTAPPMVSHTYPNLPASTPR